MKPSIIFGRGKLIRQFEKAGLLPANCRRMVIDIDHQELVKIYYECFGDKRLIDIDIPKYLGPEIKEG